MEAKADHEKLNQKPPAPITGKCHVCRVNCSRMQRCATCKNAFYCSKDCQTRAWKKGHKFECSLLPIGQLEYPAKMDRNEFKELDKEVRRISLILEKLSRVMYDGSAKPSARQLLQDIELPIAYSDQGYTRPFTDTLRAHFVRIVRLMTVHFFASRNVTLKDVEECVGGATHGPRGNGFFTSTDEMPLWIPKVVCRAGDLSPQEYMTMPGLLLDLGAKGKIGSGDRDAFNFRFMNLILLGQKLLDGCIPLL